MTSHGGAALERVTVEGVHKELGDYSHCVRCHGAWLMISGQAPVASDGELAGNDIGTQADQTLRNLRAVLTSCGLGIDTVAKLTVYLAEAADAPEFARVRREHFDPPFPASTVVVVAGLLRPERRPEMEALAVTNHTTPGEQ